MYAPQIHATAALWKAVYDLSCTATAFMREAIGDPSRRFVNLGTVLVGGRPVLQDVVAVLPSGPYAEFMAMATATRTLMHAGGEPTLRGALFILCAAETAKHELAKVEAQLDGPPMTAEHRAEQLRRAAYLKASIIRMAHDRTNVGDPLAIATAINDAAGLPLVDASAVKVLTLAVALDLHAQARLEAIGAAPLVPKR